MAYKCRITEIDNGSKFHICEKNFQVDQDPVQPFEDELVATACAHLCAPEPDNNQEARGSNNNTSNNISQGANREDIAELRRQGIEVVNDD